MSQRERIIYQAVDQQDPNENKALANEAVLYSGKKDFNSDMFGKLLEIDGILIHFAGQKTYRYELKLTWPVLFISQARSNHICIYGRAHKLTHDHKYQNG